MTLRGKWGKRRSFNKQKGWISKYRTWSTLVGWKADCNRCLQGGFCNKYIKVIYLLLLTSMPSFPTYLWYKMHAIPFIASQLLCPVCRKALHRAPQRLVNPLFYVEWELILHGIHWIWFLAPIDSSTVRRAFNLSVHGCQQTIYRFFVERLVD